jgi:RNA polymerase sigma factor (TIGR02999 family)
MPRKTERAGRGPAFHEFMDERKDAVTRALVGAAAGDDEAAAALWDLTYEELRRIAQRYLHRERADHTLSATALVHEAYLRLVDQTRIQFRDRAHFFAVASKVCRRILVDYARRRSAEKRGGARVKVTLNDAAAMVDSQSEELLALNEALDRLSELNERLGRVVEMRFFGGLSEEETADALGVTTRTVRRDWVKAKGFLYDALYGGAGPPATSTV